jgi:hypothetical protein
MTQTKSRDDNNGAMDCPECTALESTRYECIKRYVEAVEVRTRQNGHISPECNTAIASAESELNRAWNRLEEHRTSHIAEEVRS